MNNNNLISNGPPKINYNNINIDKKKNFISEGRPIDPNNVFKTNNQNIRRATTIPDHSKAINFKLEIPTTKEKDKAINKSINKPKIKESKAKKTVKIIAKATLIASILAVLITGGFKMANKVSTHIEGEQIKAELVLNFEERLKALGIDKEYLEQYIEIFDKDFLENNLFEFYLITENNPSIMNRISKKLYNKNFSNYIIQSGYFEQSYDNNGKATEVRYPTFLKWENAMEAMHIKEKEERESKEKQQENKQFEEFQNYSKGAR